MHPKTFSLKYLVGLLAAILFGILYFGLGPESIWFPNGAKLISDQPGIRFSDYGCVFTDLFSEMNSENTTDAEGISVEISLEPAVFDANGFAFVWVLHGGRDRNQLVMGQYRSYFIVMNGDDYDHKRKTKRITADADPLMRGKRFITITSGPEGTRIYADGRLVRTKSDLILKIPTGDHVRLLIGNSVSCKHSWQGDVYGLAVYRYSLTDSAVARHYERWGKSKNFSFAEKEAPFLLYLFDEKTGTRAIDHAGGNRHLHIPPTTKVLERQFLLTPRNGIDVDTLISKDVIINLVGFVPLGFVLCATIAKFRGIFRKYDVFIALVICFGVSLLIEITQAWIPSRNSDLLDLVFNTIGGLSGAVAYLTISNRIGTAIDQ